MKTRNSVLFVLIAASTLSVRFVPVAAQTPAQPQASMGAQQAVTFRVAGSSLVDVNGVSVGNVEALSVDPQTGLIRFAMVSQGYPAERMTLTPIPWQLIQHRSDARAAGGVPGTFQQLTVPISREVLQRAPTISAQAASQAGDAIWMANSSAYFASVAPARGGISAGQGTQSGIGAGNAALNPNAGFPAAAATNGSLPANSFPATNASAGAGAPNQAVQQQPGGANVSVPGGVAPPGTGEPTLPSIQPGTSPTIPPGAVPPANGGAPPRIPLAPARPAAPAGR